MDPIAPLPFCVQIQRLVARAQLLRAKPYSGLSLDSLIDIALFGSGLVDERVIAVGVASLEISSFTSDFPPFTLDVNGATPAPPPPPALPPMPPPDVEGSYGTEPVDFTAADYILHLSGVINPSREMRSDGFGLSIRGSVGGEGTVDFNQGGMAQCIAPPFFELVVSQEDTLLVGTAASFLVEFFVPNPMPTDTVILLDFPSGFEPSTKDSFGKYILSAISMTVAPVAEEGEGRQLEATEGESSLEDAEGAEEGEEEQVPEPELEPEPLSCSNIKPRATCHIGSRVRLVRCCLCFRDPCATPSERYCNPSVRSSDPFPDGDSDHTSLLQRQELLATQ